MDQFTLDNLTYFYVIILLFHKCLSKTHFLYEPGKCTVLYLYLLDGISKYVGILCLSPSIIAVPTTSQISPSWHFPRFLSANETFLGVPRI